MGTETILLLAVTAAGAATAVVVWGAFKLGLFRGDRSVDNSDEDVEAFGTVVKVTERLTRTQVGRVFFQGTTWPARASKGVADVGDEVRIVDRENLVWIVEPLDPLQLNP